MNVRKLLFNMLDRKKGSPVADGMRDLAAQFDGGFGCVNERKRNIVQHVTSTVPYYREYEGVELQDLPIIEKK